MVAVPSVGMAELVELVNEYADAPREAAGEQGAPYPDVAGVLGNRVPGDPRAAANAMYRVFASPNVLDELNGLLRVLRPTPVVTERGLRWTVEAAEDVLLAALGACLLDWLLTHDRTRLGTCEADRCVDVYADSSPAGRRRFCSSTCLNRHKVAAYRRRVSG